MGRQSSLDGDQTRWITCAGDGSHEYRRGSIECGYDGTPLDLPDWLVAARRQVEEEASERRRRCEAGESTPRLMYNEPRYAFAGFEARLECGRPLLTLCFRPSDYFTFAACQQSLKKEVMTSESGKVVSPIAYLARLGWQQPVPVLSHSFGISLAVVTLDGFLAVGRRSQEVHIRPGEIGMAVGEGLSRADHDPATDAPDVLGCAVRGAQEELGIALSEKEARLLSLGVDVETSQWGMLGVLRAGLSADGLLQAWQQGARDAFEQSLEFVAFTPRDVAGYVRSNGPWAPEAVACAYQALVRAFGHEEAERAHWP